MGTVEAEGWIEVDEVDGVTFDVFVKDGEVIAVI
jgi:hypothetical protein